MSERKEQPADKFEKLSKFIQEKYKFQLQSSKYEYLEQTENSSEKEKEEVQEVLSEQLILKDNAQEFILLRYSVFDGIESIQNDKLNTLHDYTRILKRLNHVNIVKYLDEFLFEFDYYVIFEKQGITLNEFIKNQESMNRELFLNIALQLIDATQYLFENNLTIYNISLDKIFIDEGYRIYLSHFNLPKTCPQNTYQQLKHNHSNGFFKISYTIPPESIDFDSNPSSKKLDEQIEKNEKHNENKVYSNNQLGDIWSIGICLHVIGGSSFQSAFKITVKSRNRNSYSYIKSLDFDINYILAKILQKDPQMRPSIAQIKRYFLDCQSVKEILTEEYYVKKFSAKLTKGEIDNELIQILKKLVLIFPENEWYSELLARALAERGDLDEASDIVKRLLEINSQNPKALYVEAIIHTQKNDVISTISSLVKAIKANPSLSFSTRSLYTVIKSKKEFLQQGITFFLQMIEDHPKNQNFLKALCMLYAHNEEIGNCNEYLDKLQNIESIQAEFLEQIGIILQEKKRDQDALNFLQRSIKIDRNANVMIRLGSIHNLLKLYTKGIILYKEALSLQSKSTKTDWNYAVAHFCQQQYEIPLRYKKQSDDSQDQYIRFIKACKSKV